jgi:hypothetical protein
MDFDGFLVQMRIELEGVERAAAPLWELAMPAGTDEAPDDFIVATATAER